MSPDRSIKPSHLDLDDGSLPGPDFQKINTKSSAITKLDKSIIWRPSSVADQARQSLEHQDACIPRVGIALAECFIRVLVVADLDRIMIIKIILDLIVHSNELAPQSHPNMSNTLHGPSKRPAKQNTYKSNR